MRAICDFAEIALDVKLAGVAHAAMRQHAGLAGAMPRFGGEILGGVGEGAEHRPSSPAS